MPIEKTPTGKRGAVSHNTSSPMAEMIEQYLSCGDLEHGQIVKGTIVRISPTEVIVDVGAKCEGIVPERDLELLSPAERAALAVGSEVMAYIVTPEDANGDIILSLSRAQASRDWLTAQQFLESQQIIEREVIGYNKGGVIVQIGKIRGFVPGSQLAVSRATQASNDSEETRWSHLVGQTLSLKVIEVDVKRNRLILSERAALQGQRESQRDKLLRELTEGAVLHGRVINLVDFGAFVDIGGIDGLVHLSEISWKRISHPREELQVGQEVEAYVLSVDQERKRVALSLKRLQPDPWKSATQRYREGQLVEGVITSLAKWGAFASIVNDEGVEGMIHISELSDTPIVHPREVVKPGQVVTLRVLGLDAEHRRLALSLKQAAAEEYIGQDWKAALADDRPTSESALSVALSEAIKSSEDSNRPPNNPT